MKLRILTLVTSIFLSVTVFAQEEVGCLASEAQSFEGWTHIELGAGNYGSTEMKPADPYLDEFKSLSMGKNPQLEEDTSYIWVLSARNNYRKNPQSNPLPQDSEALDLNDTFDRVNLAVSLARQVGGHSLSPLASSSRKHSRNF